MSSLLLELGYNEILSANMADNLRNYIASRNSSLSAHARAGIFADAVNRIVDSRLPKFSQELAKKLKDKLFTNIISKPVFSIDCADVFKSAVELKTPSYEFFRELNDWLCGLLKKAVNRESLFDYVIQAHKLMDSKSGTSISEILESLEESTGGLKYEIQEPDYAAVDIVGEEAEAVTAEQYDYSDSIMEYVRTDNSTYRYTADGASLKKTGFLGMVKKSIQSIEPKRVAVTSVFAAAALILIFFAGYRINAASNINKANSLNLLSSVYSKGPNVEYVIAADNSSMISSESKRMRATAYDLSIESCGKSPEHPQYGITSSGTKATAGRTVAVDPEVIPLGSRVYISFPTEYSSLDGVYYAEDTGTLIKGDSIDIFFGEDKEGSREVYEKAMEFGVRYVDVKVLD